MRSRIRRALAWLGDALDGVDSREMESHPVDEGDEAAQREAFRRVFGPFDPIFPSRVHEDAPKFTELTMPYAEPCACTCHKRKCSRCPQ